MKLRRLTRTAGSAMALLCAVAMSSAQVLSAPPSTVFTYQGQLKESGVPFNGDAAMEFVLFAVPTGGSSLGSEVVDHVTVVNGLFSVQLDFGASPFAGKDRWLEVRVNRVVLTPRQKITATPYALYALDSSAGNSLDASDGSPINAVFVDAGGDVGVGTTTPGRKLDVGGASAGARITNGALTGSHLELKSSSTDTISHTVGALDFTNLTDTRLGGMAYVSSFLGDRLIFSVGGEDHMFVDQAGRLGIGTTFPGALLHVEGGTEASLSGGGFLVLGATNDYNLVMDRSKIQARNDGAASSLFLNPNGGGVIAGGDTTIIGSSTGTPLHVTGGRDAEPASGGVVVIGATSGTNIAMDTNEIMARNDGATSTLYLNADGGDVVVGGSLNIGYQIIVVSRTSDGGPEHINADCPTGKKILGGGCSSTGNSDYLTSSHPVDDNAWHCFFIETQEGHTVRAYAICANVK